VRAGFILSSISFAFTKSAFWIPDQPQSSRFSAWEQFALRVVSETDSICRSSLSFCLRASSIAPSSARELDAISALRKAYVVF